MIIGAMKSGTTSLAHYLSTHPEIDFCINKEPGYFYYEKNWKNNINKYHGLFNPKPGQISGEASTMYTQRPMREGTYKKLHEYNSNLKLIYIMRDPVERIVSHYAHNFVRQRINKPMSEEVFSDISYIARSLYYYQLEPYLQLFPRENLHLVIFEDFVRDPAKHMREIASFLEINQRFYLDKEVFSPINKSENRKILADGKGIGKLISPLKNYRHLIPELLINIGLSLIGNRLDEKPMFPKQLKAKLYNELKFDRMKIEKLLGHEVTKWSQY